MLLLFLAVSARAWVGGGGVDGAGAAFVAFYHLKLTGYNVILYWRYNVISRLGVWVSGEF
jgi:hypothetical protein